MLMASVIVIWKLKYLTNHPSGRSLSFLGLSCVLRRILAIIIGVSVKEKIRDSSVRYTTVMPKNLINSPAIPPINASGKNTTKFVPAAAITAIADFFVPFIAASSGDAPAFNCASAASIRIIALVIKVPRDVAIAKRVITFMENPDISMKKKPDINDTGITTAAITVVRQFFVNANKITTVSNMPRSMLLRVLFVSLDIVVDVSEIMCIDGFCPLSLK